MSTNDPTTQAGTPPVVGIPPLHPGLRPFLRADGVLQLGEDPVHGMLIDGLADGEAAAVCRLLGRLAGAVSALPLLSLVRETGLSEARVREVASVIERAGLTRVGPPVLPAGGLAAWSLSRLRSGPELALAPSPQHSGGMTLAERRAGARVAIDGRGGLAAEIARVLTLAQIGQVRSGWYAGLAEDLDATSPDASVIITVSRYLPRSRARDWHERGIPHLPVLVRTASVTIGPLIVPGTGPCLACVAHSEVAGPLGLTDDPVMDGQSDNIAVEPALGAVAAGIVAMLTLGLVDAYPPPLGVRWHCALPLPSLATSRSVVHPDCSGRWHRRDRWRRADDDGLDEPGTRLADGVASHDRQVDDETMTA